LSELKVLTKYQPLNDSFHLHTNIHIEPAQAEAILSTWLGRKAHCSRIVRLKGGMINTVLRLEFEIDQAQVDPERVKPSRVNASSVVVKLNSPEAGFEDEARALRFLREHTRFPSPAVYLEDHSAEYLPYAFLLIEDIPGIPMNETSLLPQQLQRLDEELAEVLLELHAHTRKGYGGLEGPVYERWSDVFLPRLINARSQAEVNQRLSAQVLADVDRAIELAEDVFGVEQTNAEQEIPRLVHGDIWAGNIILKRAQDGWSLSGIVDPGLQFADVEMELAYLESFDNPRPVFFKAYTRSRPLRDGYPIRRLFYWLHTYLIHVWLFGDMDYCDLAARTAAMIRESV